MGDQKKILVVDDELDVLIYLSTLFEDHEFETVTAENGVMAVELAKSEKPDLVTLDITMPEQSGLKTYQYFKREPELNQIPIIIITAVGDPIHKVLDQMEGLPKPEGFMGKPVDREELITLVNDLVG